MKVENKSIQHLGLVAGMCKEIRLAETIDALLPDSKRKVSVGDTVVAMILNALGFTGRAMYLTPESFRNKPVESLIREGITPEDLNDDCLGTALDALYEHGVTELFYDISSHALKMQGVEHKFVHLDSTSFSLHGDYENAEEDRDEKLVTITKGLSKDHAPELNQVILSMMCSHKSTLPVWIEVLSGNRSDKSSFQKSIKEFRTQFKDKELPYFVADSALYSKKLNELEGIKWVTRVPETIKEAKQHISELDKNNMISWGGGYSYTTVKSQYGDIDQRWLIVFSEKSYEREIRTFKKNLEKEKTTKENDLWHMGNTAYACETDAIKAVQKYKKKLRYHSLTFEVIKKKHYEGKGRPSKNSVPTGESWFISGTLSENSEAIDETAKRKGIFIIATNETDQGILPDNDLLDVYKAQGVSVERGFRFLKDPMFYAESLYLKSPKRIMALIMVMTLSLLVYSLTERKLRQALKDNDAYISSQVGKQIQNPTIRWVFQKFEAVLMLTIIQDGSPPHNEATYLEQDHITVLECLGEIYKKMYFL